MSINPSHDNFKHIEFLPGNKQIKYKPASSFDSLSNLFNIRAIFSSIRAMLASFFGPSNAATEIRHNFKVINETKGVDNDIRYSATKLLSSLRSQPPADVSLSEAQRLRADSALALFNMGFFSTIVENYADWQTEGSAKEGEVWQRAYDELLSNNLHDLDPDIGALLLDKVDARYSGSEKIKHKIDIGKALLTSNYKKALKSLKKAIEDESNPDTKKRFEQALEKLEAAFISYKDLERDFTNYDAVTNAWFQLNLAVEDIPKVYDLMSKGYTNPANNLSIKGALLLNKYDKALEALNAAIAATSKDQPREKERLERARASLQAAVSDYDEKKIDATKLQEITDRCSAAVAGTPAEEIMKKAKEDLRKAQ